MKRQIQKTGKRKWFGDDWLLLQDEIYTALEALLLPYGNFILSGCGVSGNDIAAGVVYLGGKVCKFDGATTVAFPCYLELTSTEIQNRIYEDGNSKPTLNEYKAVHSATVPAGDSITIESTGGKKFLEAIQDSTHRFTTDTEKNTWDAKLAASAYTAADVLSKILTVDGSGSGLDADKLDGHDDSYFLPAENYTAADVLAKILAVDGSGSGLDADLLDGKHSGGFCSSDSYAGNLNDLIGSGIFGLNPGVSSIPPGASGSGDIVLNLYRSSNSIIQYYFSHNSDTMWVRRYPGTTWSTWKGVFLSQNSKKLTGTTSSSSSGYVDISHGLTQSKILSCNVIVDNTYLPSDESGFQYRVYVMSSAIRVSLVGATNLLSKPIKIFLEYEE